MLSAPSWAPSSSTRRRLTAASVTAGDFYADRHRAIFEAMLAVVNDDEAEPDAVTVTDALKRLGLHDLAGGPAYLAELINAVPTAFHSRLTTRASWRGSLLCDASSEWRAPW